MFHGAERPVGPRCRDWTGKAGCEMRDSILKCVLAAVLVLVIAVGPALAGVPKVVMAENFGATW